MQSRFQILMLGLQQMWIWSGRRCSLQKKIQLAVHVYIQELCRKLCDVLILLQKGYTGCISKTACQQCRRSNFSLLSLNVSSHSIAVPYKHFGSTPNPVQCTCKSEDNRLKQ